MPENTNKPQGQNPEAPKAQVQPTTPAQTQSQSQTPPATAPKAPEPTQAELELHALKEKAYEMGISFHPSIGYEKLTEKIELHELQSKAKEAAQAQIEPVSPETETPGQRRQRVKKEAVRLVRARIACMNPAKSDWEGEIFTCGNTAVGSITKYIPFNAEEGWHIPVIILKQIQARQCQTFYTVTDHRGNKTRKGRLIKEFSVEILPNLTPEELKELAQRQAMSNSIDD